VPNFADLLSSLLNPPDPNDLLRDPMGQGQTLTGMARIPVPGKPHIRPKLPLMAPSVNVPGPLAALARRMPAPGKPHIRLKLR
jgi:hypothetical protein